MVPPLEKKHGATSSSSFYQPHSTADFTLPSSLTSTTPTLTPGKLPGAFEEADTVAGDVVKTFLFFIVVFPSLLPLVAVTVYSAMGLSLPSLRQSPTQNRIEILKIVFHLRIDSMGIK